MRVEQLGMIAQIYGYREDEARRALEAALAVGEGDVEACCQRLDARMSRGEAI